MGTATALAPGLSRKLKKVLETRTDTPDLLASLNTLSSFYSENTPHARRNLRSTIEKRGLSINEEFLAASGSAQQVHRLKRVVQLAFYCCFLEFCNVSSVVWYGNPQSLDLIALELLLVCCLSSAANASSCLDCRCSSWRLEMDGCSFLYH